MLSTLWAGSTRSCEAGRGSCGTPRVHPARLSQDAAADAVRDRRARRVGGPGGCGVHNSSNFDAASQATCGKSRIVASPGHDLAELCTRVARVGDTRGASGSCPRESGRGDGAACRAAPSATYSPGAGTSTGSPSTSGAMTRTASDCAPPPISSARSSGTPRSRSASSPAPRPESMPSTAARARFSRVVEARVMPGERCRRIGQVRRALALEVGHEREPAGAGLGGEGEPAELGVVDAEQAARSRRARGRR